jgi:hypothetical protein
MPKLTYFLVVLVVSTLGLTLVRRALQLPTASGTTTTSSNPNRFQDAKQHFPTAEYDEPDLADPEKNKAKKEKQKRHNNFKLVSPNPQPWQEETNFLPEGNFDFPALPVSRSQLIVVGRVTEASAHLSEHKLNVYSEFPIILSSVLKTPSKDVTENSLLTI